MSDQGTQGLLSPWLRNRRLGAAKPFIEGTVFDFGCGSGALASLVPPTSYLGYDVDSTSVERARALYPRHRFVQSAPTTGSYDCVVSLAVIEHLHEPEKFLSDLAHLARDGGRIIISTPNPKFDFLHDLGSKIGLFSHDASEEHVSLLDRTALLSMADRLGLRVIRYERFLMGANQLLVLQKQS